MGRPFEFDDVAVRIAQVQGEPFPLCAEVGARRTFGNDAVLSEVRHDALLVEGLHPQAEVVDVASFRLRPFPAHPAQPAVDGHEVHHGRARPQVHEAEVGPFAHKVAAQHAPVERHAGGKVPHAEHDVIDAFDSEWKHGRRCWVGSPHSGVKPARPA